MYSNDDFIGPDYIRPF